MEAALSTVTQSPRYEAHENPSWATSLGFGLQFSMIASATLLVTPVIVANASGRGESYVTWMVFASLVVVGISTLVQVRRLGPVGAGAVAAVLHGGLHPSPSASPRWWTAGRRR